MARRRPNYNFERKQREDKKAAKKQAKLEKARAKKDEGTEEILETSTDTVVDTEE
jgi:hypothetical protein